MGTAERNAALWGARPRDWAEVQEGQVRPLYDAVLDDLRIGEGARLLDVGCGAGLATQLAAERGARVSIVSDTSIPTTRPSGPTERAKSRVKFPVPHATSSTPSPGLSPSSRRAIRCSSAIPGPRTPLATRPSAGRHQRS